MFGKYDDDGKLIPAQLELVRLAQVALNNVTGAYNALITPDPTQSEFGQYDIHGIYFITVTNIMSDDADKGSYAGDQSLAASIDNFTLTSDNTYVAGLWRGYYRSEE